MNIIKLTDETLKSSNLENIDIVILKAARKNDYLVDLEFEESYIRRLSSEGLQFVFTQLRKQTWEKAYSAGRQNCYTALSLKGYFVSKQLYEGYRIAVDEIKKLLEKGNLHDLELEPYSRGV